MDAIEAFQHALKLDVTTAQKRGSRQPVEVVDVERGCLIGAQQCGVGATPRATFIARTALFKRLHLNHARAEPYAGPSS